MNLYPDNCHPYTSAIRWLPGHTVAVIDHSMFKDENDYLYKGISDKFRQKINKALKLGYHCTVDQYDYRNERLDEVLSINQSMPVRQGREMHDSYNHPYKINKPVYCQNHEFKLILCLNPEGRIVAYMELYIVGEFSQTSRVLGHKGYFKYGIMNLLFLEAFKVTRKCRYFCYGEWISGGEGLQFFKKSLGFKPQILMI